jgi:hypothetical protein
MMEVNRAKQHQRFIRLSGFARLLIPLIVGIVLGAFLYARFGGKGLSLYSSTDTASESNKSVDSGVPSDVVQISPESQRDVGITMERLRRLESSAKIQAALRTFGPWLEASLKRSMCGWAIAFRPALP